MADSLSLTAFRGEQKALQAFIQQDTRLANDRDTLEKRPLSTAVEKDYKAMVRYLLDHGAAPKLAEGQCCPHVPALVSWNYLPGCCCNRGLMSTSRRI